MKIKRKDGTVIEYVRGDETPVSRNEGFHPTIKPDYQAEKQMIKAMREERKPQMKSATKSNSPSIKKDLKADKKRRKEEVRMRRKNPASNNEQYHADWLDKIESVKYLGIINEGEVYTTKTKTGNMIKRGIIGNVLLGGLGGVAGVATAKKEVVKNPGITKHKFFVTYRSGEGSTVTMLDNDPDFNELMKISMEK